MNVPTSPITDLHNRLIATVALNGVQTKLGSRALAQEGPARRIVMFPVDAKHVPSRDKIQNVRDADRQFAARIWGESYDGAYYLMQQFFQALEEQAANRNPGVGAPTGPGWFWKSVSEQWNIASDTTKQGESVDVVFEIIQPIAKAATTLGGPIAANQLTGTQT